MDFTWDLFRTEDDPATYFENRKGKIRTPPVLAVFDIVWQALIRQKNKEAYQSLPQTK